MKSKIKKSIALMAVMTASLNLTGIAQQDFSPAEVYAVDTAVSAPEVCGQSDIVSGAVYTIESLLSNKFISVAEDNNIFQWENKKDTSQQWRIISMADGYCKIISMQNPSMALTVEKGSKDDGANISLSPIENSDSQLFKINKEGGNYYITTKSSGDVCSLDVYDISTENGANICQWEYWSGDGQKFIIKPLDKKYTFIRGDLNYDGFIDSFDMVLMRKGLIGGFDDITSGVADLNADGTADSKDAQMLQDFVLGKINKFTENTYTHESGSSIIENIRYYASDAKIYKGFTETTNSGFSGESYVNYDNTTGSYVEWTVEVPADGNYNVDFRYANGTDSNRQIKLITNGDKQYGQYIDFKNTGAWTTWKDQTATVYLNKGTNTLKAYATTSDGGANMDYIEISSADETAPHSKATGGKRVESLNRGVTSAHAKNGNLVSWRLLATDNENTTFKLWKNGKDLLGTFTTAQATNYFDKDGTATDTYTIDTYVGDECTEFAQPSLNFTNTNGGQSGAYFDIQLKQPADLTMPDGTTCSYSPNDCSVGDVDGDGEYEIIVKWDPNNSKDNANNGYTGNVYIDCYKLNGTFMWRVDLGKNIRAGAHYTQFMVYDFDGDGKAEMICKTADGTTDGTGKVIGNKNADYRSTAGRILEGAEYLTLFEGATGKALDTIDFKPSRGNVSDWGDNYGNRVDRFTACVAYLDGTNPYACFGRGYYTRSAVTAYSVQNGKLKEYWAYDTGHNSSVKGYGDGNHHIMGADVDGDGKDEVVLGAAVIDHNGKLLYTNGQGHGDALHIGDFDPANPGLEIFEAYEETSGVSLRDGKTGKELYRAYHYKDDGNKADTGRCIADNLIAGNGGAEFTSVIDSVLYSATGNHEKVALWSDITKWGMNSVVYWTDTAERSVLDRTMLDQYGKGRVFTGDGVGYNNASKSNACITCDLTGDWREEMLFPCGSDKIRVFTTTYTSDYNIYTLMHNPQYRVQVASQNNGYNQPPHTDFYLDSVEYTRPEEPDVWTK